MSQVKFRLTTKQKLAEQAQLFAASLKVSGMALIELGYDDAGETMQEIVATLGEAIVQDAHGTVIWPVRYQNDALARSMGLAEFPLHTDASFELPPPGFIALYTVRPDNLGGGVTLLLDTRKFLPLLSSETRFCLSETLFPVRIPTEFRKDDQTSVCVPLLFKERFRYRHELLIQDQLTEAQRTAIAEVEKFLERKDLIESLILPARSLLLLDNARFLHGRSAVLDSDRLLLRMRFH